MENDGWKLQASFKFGKNQEAMLNVRANTPQELDDTCQAVNDVVGTLCVLADFLRANSVVAESFPGSTVVGSQNNPAPAYKSQPAQPAAAGVECRHGPMVKRSGPDWEGYFCPMPKDHPERCKPVYPNKR